MEKYISKSALAAELKKRFDYRVNGLKAINNGTFWDEDQSEDEFNAVLTSSAYNAVKNEVFELMCFLDTLEVKEVDEQKEKRSECPYRQVGCTMYEGKILECKGVCSWVVDYQKSKELKAQKGDNMTKKIEEIKECDGKISSNIVTDENNWYVCIKQFNNFEVGKVYCIGKNSVIAVPEFFRLATNEEISQGASMQNTDTTKPTGVRLEKCPKAQKGE